MAFNINRWGRQTVTFNAGRVVLQDAANDNAPGFFTYATSVDSLATTEAANYFSNVVFDLAVDDVIFIKASDDAEFVTVATVDRAAGTITVTSGGGIGTVTVPNGGTGLTSLTPYAIMTGGTTSTSNMQQVAVGSAGQVLRSGGASALPAYSTATFASTYAASTVLAATSLNTVIGLTYGSAAVASTIMARDANANVAANSFLPGFTTTATAAGTTVLTVGSTEVQQFTGATTQTVTMPVVSTLVLGQQYYIINDSSGVVTVQSSGANTIQAMAANTSLLLTCILVAGTGVASWQASYITDAGGTVNIGTANEIAYYATTGNAVSGLTGANSAMLVTDVTGIPAMTASLTDGQLIIGSTGATPTPGTLTAGTGISVANGAASITVNATGGGFSTVTVAGTSQACVVDTQYIALNAGQTTFTLPSTYAVGSAIYILGGTLNAGGFIVTASAGDTIVINGEITSAGGTITSPADIGQALELVCDVADTSWVCRAIVGNGVFTTA